MYSLVHFFEGYFPQVPRDIEDDIKKMSEKGYYAHDIQKITTRWAEGVEQLQMFYHVVYRKRKSSGSSGYKKNYKKSSGGGNYNNQGQGNYNQQQQGNQQQGGNPYGACERCGAPMKFVNHGEGFIGCSNFPNCRNTRPNPNN